MRVMIYGRKKMSRATGLGERGAGARATDRRYSAARSVSGVGLSKRQEQIRCCARGRARSGARDLEHFHKCCSAAGADVREAVFLTFDIVSAQSSRSERDSFAKGR